LGLVIGGDDGGAALGGDTGADLLARLLDPVIKDDLGTIAARIGDLDRRRIRRHDDERRYAERLCRRRHALGMIARGPGDDALVALNGRELRQRVVGAAELERAGALQRLGLDEQAAAEPRIDRRRFEEGRQHRLAGDALGGGADRRDIGQADVRAGR
jgi:hypothetical protein